LRDGRAQLRERHANRYGKVPGVSERSWLHTAAEGAALASLVVAGAVLAVMAVFDVPAYLRPIPFNLSALLLLLANFVVVLLASAISARPLHVALPMVAWVMVVLVFWLGGPGGDVVIPANSPRGLLLLAMGVVPAGYALLRSNLAALPPPQGATR
jgi:hypothetical protein